MTKLFQIVRIEPIYCPIRDGLIGSRAIALPMAYHNEAYARALAGRLTREDYEACGDDHYRAVPYGQSAYSYSSPSHIVDYGYGDIPF